MRLQRADENMAWKEGLEVDQGEGVGCLEEDLSRVSPSLSSEAGLRLVRLFGIGWKITPRASSPWLRETTYKDATPNRWLEVVSALLKP